MECVQLDTDRAYTSQMKKLRKCSCTSQVYQTKWLFPAVSVDQHIELISISLLKYLCNNLAILKIKIAKEF
jgi:hypothetical protein